MIDGSSRTSGEFSIGIPPAGGLHGEVLQGTPFAAMAEAGALPVQLSVVYAAANRVHADRVATHQPPSEKVAAALDSVVRGGSLDDGVSHMEAVGFPNALSTVVHVARTTRDAIARAEARTASLRPTPSQTILYIETSADRLLSEHAAYDDRGLHQAVRLLARQLTPSPDNADRQESLTTALLHHFSDSGVAPPAALPSAVLRDGLFRLNRRYTEWATHIGLPEGDRARRLMEALLRIDDPRERQSFRQILAAHPADAAALRELLTAHLQEAFLGIATLRPAPPPLEQPSVPAAESAAAPRPRGLAARAAGAALVGTSSRPAAQPPRARKPAAASRKRGRSAEDADTTDPDSLLSEPGRQRAGVPDAVGAYLKDIGEVPLLNAAQEVELAKDIEAGLFAEERLAAGTDGLDPQYVADLKKIVAIGKRAKDNMVEANLRLVVSIARRKTRPSRSMGFLDLTQEGNTGLIRAVEKFDYTKGYKFSTYATWWINQAITRAIQDREREIRLPTHVEEDLSRMGRVVRDLARDLQRDPTDEEVAGGMEIPVEKVVELRLYGRRPVSLDGPVDDSSETTLGDLVADASPEANEHDAVVDSTLASRLEAVFAAIVASGSEGDPRAAKQWMRNVDILRHSVGLADGSQWTQDAISRKFGVSGARVGQLLAQMLIVLREHPGTEELRAYLD